jgi:hypothetical protein
MPEKDGSIEKQAEGVASEFLSSLGLTDIILGSLFLYGRYAAAPFTEKELPSSGHAVVDVALLLCAAALTGKVITLGVALVMAGMEAVLERSFFRDELRIALLQAKPDRSLEDAVRRPLQSAVALARLTHQPTARLLDRIENQAIIAYGAALLAMFFAAASSPVVSSVVPPWTLVVTAVVFAALGFFQQADYFIQSIEFLKTLAPTDGSTPMANSMTITVQTKGKISVNDAARFLLALNALHIAAALTDDQRGDELAEALRKTDLPHLDAVDTDADDEVIFRALASVNSATPENVVGALEIVKLQSGSLSSAVREILGAIFGRLKALSVSLASLRPQHDAADFEKAVVNLENEAADPVVFRRVAFIAGANARAALAKMEATAVKAQESTAERQQMRSGNAG